MNENILTDENLTLRPVEPSDADFMWEVDSDSKQWIQNSMAAPLSKENLLHYALTYDADPFRAGQLRLIIEDKNGCKIGIIDLFDISAQHRTTKLGIYILPSFRRKAYGINALQLLQQYCLLVLNLRTLCAEVTDDNLVSLGLFDKAGFSKAGVLSNWILSGRRTFSLVIFQKELL